MFVEQGIQFPITQLVQAAAGQHYSIDIWQIVLFQPEALADMAFEAVALRGKADVFFPDDQTQAGALQVVGCRQYEKVAVGYFKFGLLKHPLKIPAYE